jgi:hypothetical protein
LLGETPAKRASREAKEQADATKAENAKTAKEEKAKKRKADALETKTAKRAKVAAAKAESGSASSSTKPKPKVKAKAKAKGNPITMFFPKATVPLDEFANGLTELFDANAASAGPTAAKDGEAAEAGQDAGAVAKEPKPNGAWPVGTELLLPYQDAAASDSYSDDDGEDALCKRIAVAEDKKVQLRGGLDDPDATAVKIRDTCRLYGVEVKNIDNCKDKLATIATAGQAEAGHDADDSCNESGCEDDPVVLREELAEAEAEKSRLLIALEDPTLSPDKRAHLNDLLALYNKEIRDYKYRLSRLCPMAV